MHINGARVALGAVAGAGVIAAAAAGLDALVDDKLVEQGVNHTLQQIAGNNDLIKHGIAYYAQPTMLEQFGSYAADKLGDAGQALGVWSPNEIVINTLQGPVEIGNINTLSNLLNSNDLSAAAKTQLQGVITEFVNQASQQSNGQIVALGANSSVTEMSQALHDIDSYFSGKTQLLNGITTINPASIPGMVEMPLSNGGDLYVHPEKFVAHYDALTHGLKGQELEAMEALKAHLTPALDLETIGIGAGVGGLAGAASSAAEKKFTDRIQPRAAQPVQPGRAEGQSWVQAAQADQQQQMDGPRVVR